MALSHRSLCVLDTAHPHPPPLRLLSLHTRHLPPQSRRAVATPRTNLARAQGARHPDQAAVASTSAELRASPQSRPDVESDRRYRRTDFSDDLAREARAAFAANVAGGEAAVDLAAAALQVAAEDDAIASSSTVPFPVESYLDRVAALASDCAARHPDLAGMPPAQAVQAVRAFLFDDEEDEGGGQRRRPFRVSKGGRSALPRRARLNHPGTQEAAAPAYLNEVLVRRSGHPAALAILLHDVLRRLFLAGRLPCAALVSGGDWDGLPAASPLPNLTPSAAAALPNTCSSDALVELLRRLKRSYWPFPWDSSVDERRMSHGGFRGAAKAALGSAEVTAEVRAISATAQHRLQRGIFTSPGAGDLRRCAAACERLAMLVGDAQPAERRDLGVVYMHAGLFDEARAELSEYLRRAYHGGGGGEARAREDPFDLKLTEMLLDFLDGAAGGGGGAGAEGSVGGGSFYSVDVAAGVGGDGPGAAGRRTLLAPHAAGSAGVEIGGESSGSDGDDERGGSGGSGSGGSGGKGGDGGGATPPLMSVEAVLEAARRGEGVGLLGAQRGRLPLTW